MERNNKVYTGTVSIAILVECLLMVTRAASAKVLVLLLLKDVRFAAVFARQSNLLPYWKSVFRFPFFLPWSFVHEEAGRIILS